jgi:hypothetical protein
MGKNGIYTNLIYNIIILIVVVAVLFDYALPGKSFFYGFALVASLINLSTSINNMIAAQKTKKANQ